MTDDIVGNVAAEDGTTDSTSMRIFAADPDNSPSRELGRYVWALDRVYLPNFEVLPVWRLDRIGRGGDHEPYVNLGDAGLRFTERLENYNRQHLPTDDFVARELRLRRQRRARERRSPSRSLAAAPADAGERARRAPGARRATGALVVRRPGVDPELGRLRPARRVTSCSFDARRRDLGAGDSAGQRHTVHAQAPARRRMGRRPGSAGERRAFDGRVDAGGAPADTAWRTRRRRARRRGPGGAGAGVTAAGRGRGGQPAAAAAGLRLLNARPSAWKNPTRICPLSSSAYQPSS